jgi:fructose-1,6-bisphosphatase
MQTKDFTVFQVLLSEIHQKAFNEPISKLSYSKAQMLSWLISNDTNRAGLIQIFGCAHQINSSQEEVQKLDIFCKKVRFDTCTRKSNPALKSKKIIFKNE